MPQIIVENLTKTFQVPERQSGTWGAVRGLFQRRYRDVEALRSVSFSIDSGELVGYIGPNGAGKSTTLKILSGILVPSAGVCRVLHYTPWKDRKEYVHQIGVVFGQKTQLWWDLPVIESFELLRDIYRLSASDYSSMRDRLVDRLQLSSLLSTPVRQLSLGQRMRCDLAASLLHRPRLLFLDEPTIGLDAVSKLAVRGFIRELNREEGVTIMLTTHDMDDIEALCTRVLLIGQGTLLMDGSLETLRHTVSRERWLKIDLEDPTQEVSDPDATFLRREGNQICLQFDPQVISPAALIRRITAEYAVRDLFVENPPIETLIARLYEAHTL
jgi:ABC-2 type transport system ATP-binding protein